jgi:hypothetical protein
MSSFQVLLLIHEALTDSFTSPKLAKMFSYFNMTPKLIPALKLQLKLQYRTRYAVLVLSMIDHVCRCACTVWGPATAAPGLRMPAAQLKTSSSWTWWSWRPKFTGGCQEAAWPSASGTTLS